MENASKALLMAAGVLFAILVVSIGVMFYNNLHSASESYVSKLDAAELQKYNNPFEVLMGRTDITAQEIVTIVSESKQKDKNIKVTITNMNGYENMQDFTNEQISNFLDENIQYIEQGEGKLVYFKCIDADGDGVTYGQDGRITSITFQKVGEVISDPIIENPDIPVIVPPTNEEDDDEENNPTTNSKPYFANTSLLSTNVKDNDGDWTYVYAKVEVFTFGTDSSKSLKKYQSNQNNPSGGGSKFPSWGFGGGSSRPTSITVNPSAYVSNPGSSVFYYKDYADYAINYKTIPDEYWASVSYSSNGSKDWTDNFSSKKFTISNIQASNKDSWYGSKNVSTSEWYHIIRVKYFARDKYHDDWVESDYIYKVNECSGGTTTQVGGHYETEERTRTRDRV